MYNQAVRAEIVSVGTEILLGQIVDTNAAYLGGVLAEYGMEHTHRQTVGDNLDRLTESLRLALSRSDLVFTIGGLGPTQDDLTRDGIAAALGDELIADPALEEHLKNLFAKRNLKWVDSQLRQAMRPTCAEPIPNSNGTAPGLICRRDGKTVIALPGPKPEFEGMVNASVRSELGRLSGGRVFLSRVVRVAGIGEAMVEQQLLDLMEGGNPTVAPYAKDAEVHLRVTAAAESAEGAEAAILPVVVEIQARLGRAVYGLDEDSLETAVIRALIARGQTVGVVESCTGGGLGRRLTGVPGSSGAFVGGFLTYSNAMKERLVGVSSAVLDEHGAVSAPCAEAMASGGRERLGVDWCIAITGIAGPDGGTPEKPVGLVYVGLAGPEGVTSREWRFIGRRETIRNRATQAGLLMLWEQLG